MWRRDAFLHAKRARELKAAGLTVEQIAERLGLSKTIYGALYRERRKQPAKALPSRSSIVEAVLPQGTLRSLQAAAVPEPDAPVIECRSDSAGFLPFFCPHCQTVHYHQGGEGWHRARCSSGPFRQTGYRLEVAG
jgi:hypothetical protein